MNMVGVLLVTFIGVIVALAIFTGGITGQVGQSTNLGFKNATYANSTTNGYTYLDGKYVTSILVSNTSSHSTIVAGNYTIYNNILNANGELSSAIDMRAGDTAQGTTWQVAYTFQPLGYVPDAAGRSIVGLIVIFAALAIAVIALAPVLQSKILDMVR